MVFFKDIYYLSHHLCERSFNLQKSVMAMKKATTLYFIWYILGMQMFHFQQGKFP